MTRQLPTLYGKSSNGAIKVWTITTERDSVVINHGQLEGKMTEKRYKAEAKNLGRSNETNPEDQAVLESVARWNKQYDKDYRESISEIPVSTLPNLAHKYQDKMDHVVFPCDVLVKLDGVRCTVFLKDGEVFFQSRGGKAYPPIAEIANTLRDIIFDQYPHAVVDGELYKHGMHLEDITSAVKKHNRDTRDIKFYVFDLMQDFNCDHRWSMRSEKADILFNTYWNEESTRVLLIPPTPVDSHEEIIERHANAVNKGYEGIVIRNLHETNTFGQRTTGLIKYKERKDAEYKVVSFDIDKNGSAIPWCEIEVAGLMKKFKAPLTGTREYTQSIWDRKDKYIGKWLKVEFEAFSKYGIPAKPKGVSFRECDDSGNPME